MPLAFYDRGYCYTAYWPHAHIVTLNVSPVGLHDDSIPSVSLFGRSGSGALLFQMARYLPEINRPNAYFTRFLMQNLVGLHIWYGILLHFKVSK